MKGRNHHPSKKILIDGFHYGTGRGIGNYIKNLLENYQVSSGLNVSIVIRKKYYVERQIPNGIGVFVLPNLAFPVWENLLIPFLCWLRKPDLLHSPANTSPLLPVFAKRVVTIHDLIFMNEGKIIGKPTNWYQRLGRAYMALNVRMLIRFVDKVVTISDFSRNEIIEKFHLRNEKVTRVYEGAGTSFVIPRSEELKNNLIHFGSIDPRKNTQMVIKAFLKSNLTCEGITLSVLGLSEKGASQIKSNLTDMLGVNFYPFLEKRKIEELLCRTLCLVYPSKYEGFGMPIVEFQQAGIPVITSNGTSCSEICGAGGILVDPLSIDEISNAIIKIYKERDFANKLIHSGYQNAERFSWKCCAEETVEVYVET